MVAYCGWFTLITPIFMHHIRREGIVMKKQKVLIIKLGYSETLDPEIGRVPSLGDVMRTTVIL